MLTTAEREQVNIQHEQAKVDAASIESMRELALQVRTARAALRQQAELTGSWGGSLRDELQAAAHRYNLAVVIWNGRIDRKKAAKAKAAEKAAADRATAKVRAARCGSCFTVHAGECL